MWGKVMVNKKIGFVVLNYHGNEITQQCVDSILHYYPDNLICIVDNASQDNSVADFRQKYVNQETVIILQADKNYGFAIGNNIGINYLREQGIQYIVVINNDTIFQKSGIIEQLDNFEDGVGLISLELSNQDGTTQIPYGLIKSASKNYLKIGVINFLLVTKLYFVLRFFKRCLFRKKPETASVVDYSQYHYVISGAGYILTPHFFEHYQQLFNHTFLFNEEHILALYLQKAKLKTAIIKDTQIIHLESQTAKLKPLCFKKLCRAIASWIKGLSVFFKNSTKIRKRFSNKNYCYKIIKGDKGENL